MLIYQSQICGYGGIGRHARFRILWETVQVQVLLPAPSSHTRGFTYVSEQHSSGKVAAFFCPHCKAAPPAAPARGRPVRRAAEARSGDRLRSIVRGLRPQPTRPCREPERGAARNGADRILAAAADADRRC